MFRSSGTNHARKIVMNNMKTTTNQSTNLTDIRKTERTTYRIYLVGTRYRFLSWGVYPLLVYRCLFTHPYIFSNSLIAPRKNFFKLPL